MNMLMTFFKKEKRREAAGKREALRGGFPITGGETSRGGGGRERPVSVRPATRRICGVDHFPKKGGKEEKRGGGGGKTPSQSP